MTARYPAFRHKNFTLLWGGLLVSNVGTWMQNVAQAWVIYKMTGNDPIYLGWLGLCFAVPMVVMPPVGGVVADRVDRKRLLYFTQTAQMALAALLALLTWTGALRPAHILATTVAGAVLLAFDNPARQSLVPDLVPREALQNALSLNAATYTTAGLIGPAIAGALLDVVGAGWLFLLNAVSFLAVLFALVAMRDVPKHAQVIPPLRDALFGGVVYAFGQRWVRGLLALSALAALFARSYQQLLPVFANDVFRVGARGYGMLLAGAGGGAVLGALALSASRDIARKGLVMVVAGSALAATLIAFALAPRFPLAVALLVVAGIAASAFTTMIATMIQLRVPGPLRGRVVSLYVSTLIGLPSLGSLAVAALAKRIGAPYAVASSAALFAALLALLAPRHARGGDTEAPPGVSKTKA